MGGGPQARRSGRARRAASIPRASSGASLLAAAQSHPVKQKLADNTAAAVARGVFGVPTFFVGDEMFFGKERLGQVEEAVEATMARAAS